jgi:hypothetical protein
MGTIVIGMRKLESPESILDLDVSAVMEPGIRDIAACDASVLSFHFSKIIITDNNTVKLD